MSKNIEISTAKKTIDLLNLYGSDIQGDQKDDLLKQLRATNYGAWYLITSKNYNALDLAKKIKKVIKLNKYRPKNMQIIELAISEDLDCINGPFDTNNITLNKMVKNKEAPEKIREKFLAGIANIYVLAEQFSNEWIKRLNKYKELVKDAKNSNEDNEIEAYKKLFNALTKDFCKKYKCRIHVNVLSDWAQSDCPPKCDFSICSGHSLIGYDLVIPKNLSILEINNIKQKFDQDPQSCPYSIPSSLIELNIADIKKKCSQEADLFYIIMSYFVHEIHHALDYQNPRQGALGPQIYKIDDRIYERPELHSDNKNYKRSATEMSSIYIQQTFIKKLKELNF